ncbi:hypothetical protein [Clostridium sp. UBA3061]|uniref:hypothetical protein n=1 Tax=Clostridium sp. UBA3061 TaxID=1946353 RepID=UPI0032178485
MGELTIIQQFSAWVSENWAVSAIAGGVFWDVIKGQLLIPFKAKFGKYFNNDKEVEEYLQKISETESINKKKPIRDIEDVYEDVTQKDLPDKFIDELKEFLISNNDKVEMMNKQSGDFTGLNQQAGRDINNVKGSQTIINYGRE